MSGNQGSGNVSTVKFETVDDVCNFIRQHSMLGEWSMNGEMIRSRGFCPVCWIAKKLNPESTHTVIIGAAMELCGRPMSHGLMVLIASIADASRYCDIEDRRKLLVACGIIS